MSSGENYMPGGEIFLVFLFPKIKTYTGAQKKAAHTAVMMQESGDFG